jgi:penicillin V acylase-like amidase (Ntn superfamily)
MTTPGQPNIASTVWRTLYDQKDKVFYFDSATSPTVFCVPLADIDFKEGAAVKKLDLDGGKTYSGNASAHFKVAKPFVFLPGNAKQRCSLSWPCCHRG